MEKQNTVVQERKETDRSRREKAVKFSGYYLNENWFWSAPLAWF